MDVQSQTTLAQQFHADREKKEIILGKNCFVSL